MGFKKKEGTFTPLERYMIAWRGRMEQSGAKSLPSERLRWEHDRHMARIQSANLPPLEMDCYDAGPPIAIEHARAVQRAAFFIAVMGALFFALVIGGVWRFTT